MGAVAPMLLPASPRDQNVLETLAVLLHQLKYPQHAVPPVLLAIAS